MPASQTQDFALSPNQIGFKLARLSLIRGSFIVVQQSYRSVIFSFLNKREKLRFFILLAAMVLYSFLESVGLAMIGPYLAVLISPETIIEYAYIAKVFQYFSIPIEGAAVVYAVSAVFVSLLTVKCIFGTILNAGMSRFPYEIINPQSEKLFRQYIQMDYIQYCKSRSSDLIKNMTNTNYRTADVIVYYLRYLKSACVTVFLLSLTFYRDPLISLAIFTFMFLTSFTTYKLLKKKQMRFGEIQVDEFAKAYRVSGEAFLAFKEINLFDKFNFFLNRYLSACHRLSDSLRGQAFYSLLPVQMIEYIVLSCLIFVVTAGVTAGVPLEILVPQLIFYAVVAKQLMPVLHQMLADRTQLIANFPHMLKFQEELQRTKREKPLKPVEDKEFHSYLKVEGLEFSYNKDKKIIDGISFLLKKGESIAFVGSSGAGKTTLVELIISLLTPQKGTFCLDGQSMESFAALKHVIGYVPQVVTLLDDTIENNIAFGEDKIDETKLNRAIGMSYLKDFIDSLKEGTKTKIGERGIMLSGGQKQRIGIARALYHNPSILIFDEATSSLDNISEEQIKNTIDSLSNQKTIIAIAHRLSTIQEFDCIYMMEQGSIIASGTHEQLLQSSIEYQKLARQDVRPAQEQRDLAQTL